MTPNHLDQLSRYRFFITGHTFVLRPKITQYIFSVMYQNRRKVHLWYKSGLFVCTSQPIYTISVAIYALSVPPAQAQSLILQSLSAEVILLVPDYLGTRQLIGALLAIRPSTAQQA